MLSLLLKLIEKSVPIDPMMIIPNAIICGGLTFYACFRCGFKLSVLVSIITTSIIAVVDRFGLLSIILIPSIWLGTISYIIYLRYNNESVYLFSIAAVFLTLFAILNTLFFMVNHGNPIAIAKDGIAKTLDETETTFNTYFLKNSSTEQKEVFKKFFEDYRKRYPFYVGGIMLSIFCLGYYGVFYITRKYSILVFKKPLPFITFKIKEPFILVFIVGLVIEILSYVNHNDTYRYISKTILIFTMSVYFIQGILITSIYLKRFKFRRFSTIMFWITIVLFNILWLPIGIGLLDTWFDFRNKNMREKEDESNTP